MTTETERIEILLRAKDKDLARAIDRSNKVIARFEKQATRSVTRASKTVDANLNRIGQSIKVFAGTVLGGALVVGANAAVNHTRQVVKGIASIGDEARRSGLGVREFQEFSFVAEQTRIPIDALIDGMKELNLRVDEFVVTGKGPAAEALARMGFSASDLKARLEDPSELLLEIIDRMEGLDRAGQIRVADEVFGGTAGERFVELLAQGDEGIRALMSRAHELGLVLETETITRAQELDQKFAEITARVSTLAKTLVVNLAGAIDEALSIDLDDIFGSAERAMAMLGEENYRALTKSKAALDEHRETAKDLASVYEDMFLAIQSVMQPDRIRIFEAVDVAEAHEMADILNNIMSAMDGFNNGALAAEDFKVEVADLVVEAEELLASLEDVDRARFPGVVSAIGAISAALAAATARAGELAAALPEGDPETVIRGGPSPRRSVRPPSKFAPSKSPRPRLPGVDAGFGSPRPGGGGARDGGVDELRREIEATKDAIAELEQEAASMLIAAGYGHELGDAMEFARKRAELLVAAQQAGKTIMPQLTAEIDALAMAYMEAGLAAEESEARLDRLRDNASRGADAMTDLFLSIREGSDAARSAVAGLLAEMARIQLQKAFLGASKSGGVLGAIGSLLSFDGGGYTGNAPRAGGLDGKGGYLAMMHPRETVIDHARGTPGGGGGGAARLYIEIGAPEHVTIQEVRGEAMQISYSVSQHQAKAQQNGFGSTAQAFQSRGTSR